MPVRPGTDTSLSPVIPASPARTDCADEFDGPGVVDEGMEAARRRLPELTPFRSGLSRQEDTGSVPLRKRPVPLLYRVGSTDAELASRLLHVDA